MRNRQCLAIALMLIVAACDHSRTSNAAPTPAPAALRSPLTSAAPVEGVGQYLNARYLARVPNGACRDFRTPVNVLFARRVSAPLPDSSWVTIRADFAPDSATLQRVRYERKYANGSAAKYWVEANVDDGAIHAVRGASVANMRQNGIQTVAPGTEVGGMILSLGRMLQRDVCAE